MKIDFKIGSASADVIRAHLDACDADFLPPLSTRVDIAEYSRKLRARSVTFEAWSGDTLAGLVAVYLNPDSGSCFVSDVSVRREFARQGIGGELVRRCVDHAASVGLRTASLSVHSGNKRAIRLYERAGFDIVVSDAAEWIMRRRLRGDEAEV
jgi:ribosomal-protein-alanine N-acetyltransferase